ncbi:MAG: hypothetical protein R6X34_14595 [Chloroflexota bacterium]
MNDVTNERWELKVRETAVAFPYPPTPDLTDGVRSRLTVRQRAAPRRSLAWAITLLLLLAAALFSVPQVRATVAEMFRLGAITFVERPQPAAGPAAAATLPPLTDAILAALTPLSLPEARDQLTAPLRLPSYPANLGLPDDVYASGETAVFLWRDSQQPATVRLSLYHIEVETFATKAVEMVQATAVNGREAFWVEGGHLFLADGRYEPWLFVEGRVLIWWEGDVTYRLEGAASLDEAIRIAESLAVWED